MTVVSPVIIKIVPARSDFVSSAASGLRSMLLVFTIYQAALENGAALTGVSSRPLANLTVRVYADWNIELLANSALISAIPDVFRVVRTRARLVLVCLGWAGERGS